MTTLMSFIFLYKYIRMKKIIFILTSLLILASCARNHVLFENGASDYSIVIDKNAPASEQYAASELRDHIAKVSGVTLPIVDLNEGVKGKRLIVGYNALVEDLLGSVKEPSPSDDSFTWCSKGGDLLFWGGSERGTLYSVYDFLEENLGCRWYSSKVTVTPECDSWSFKKLYVHEVPGLKVRDNCIYDVRTDPTFSARMRNNFIRLPGARPGETLEGTAEGYWGVHAMGYHLPAGRYFAEHPEYFGLHEGRRYAEGGDYQLCLSNPDVLQICIESIRKVMRENKDYMIYSMEQLDNPNPCQCEACQALVEQYGGESGLMIWFVNQVADAVKDEFPDKYIGTFAYRYTRHAPTGIVPRDNVVVRLCSIECCLHHEFDECEQNQPFMKDLQDWSAIAKNLYIWDYLTDFRHYCLPVANFRMLQPKLQDFRDHNTMGILEQGDYQTQSCELKELRAYLVSKLLWNPDIDVDAVIMDFTEGYYGAAGQYVREYIDYTDRVLRRPGMHTDCYAIPQHPMYTGSYIREGLRILEKGKKAVADDPELLKRVEAATLPLCFLYLEKMPVEAIQKGIFDQFKKVVAQEGIDAMSEYGGVMHVADYIKETDRLMDILVSQPALPAQKASRGSNGIAYTRYEGEFFSTGEMLSKGKVTDKGTCRSLKIDEDPASDHFGYVFDAWVDAPEDGVYTITIVSDDGTVLLVDGKEVINLDGSHTVLSSRSFVKLQRGMHRFTLRYFDDCEGQKLDLKIHAPNGYEGPLPVEICFLP